MGILGFTFSFLWFEMYVSSRVSSSIPRQKKSITIALVLCVLFNVASIVFHITFIFLSYPDTTKRMTITLVDASISIVCGLNLTLTGCLLIKNIRFAFTGRIRSIISNRVICIMILSGGIYMCKTSLSILCAPYVYEYTKIDWFKTFTANLILLLLNYIVLEIIPVLAILLLLKVYTSQIGDFDSILSVLVPSDDLINIGSSRRILSNRLLTQSSVSRNSSFEVTSNECKTLPNYSLALLQ